MSNIDFGKDDHTTVVGRTRSGKTTGVLYSLQRQPRGVLFFNTQQIKFPAGWTRASLKSDFEAMIDGLIGGEKIVYIPSREYRQQELKILVGLLYKAAQRYDGDLDIYLVVDEVHLFAKAALRACVEVATTGIRWGLKAIWISQRPAKIDNTLMTQSTRFVIYGLSHMEGNYLKNYQMPSETIFEALRTGGQYAYVVYDGYDLSKPQKVAM
ncbi:hypothetical protein ACFQZE_24480 [Paenibacillus sp. GCM10027627]|uniref:hypothetical protein n=1 Tax=unclassified Paenibacillus TaxID=185978 RepID=UPI003639149F